MKDPSRSKVDVGLRNPLKDSEAVVEESGGGSNANRRISTIALFHSPILSLSPPYTLRQPAFVNHPPHDALLLC